MESSRSFVFAALLVGGCRPGLPPEPPGADAADPEAPIGRGVESRNPFERSAFEGEALDEGGHDHGAHEHGAHAGHGQPASKPKKSAGHEHHGGAP